MKIGDKVVYIGGCKNQLVKPPTLNEIVTIHSKCPDCDNCGHFVVSEHMFAPCGGLQKFHYSEFRKLDYEFAENLLAEISESMKSESIKN